MNDPDLKSLPTKPWLQSRFSFGQINQHQALQGVFKVLKSHGAKPADVLTLFNPEVVWSVPARYSTSFSHSGLLPRITTEMSVQGLAMLFERTCDLVAKYGMQEEALENLVAAFGNQAALPLVFTRSKPSAQAVRLFKVEFALAMTDRPGALVVTGADCYIRLRSRTAPSEVVGLFSTGGSNRRPDWLHEMLFHTRGTIKYNTFDTLDRCLLWGETNLVGYEKSEFGTALLSIKSQKNVNLTAQFDKLVFDMNNVSEDGKDDNFDSTFHELLYNEATLEQICFIWNMGDIPQYSHYLELYQYLVPNYYTAKQFRTLFGLGYVAKNEFDFSHIEKIDQRFDEFVAFFKRMMPRSKL